MPKIAISYRRADSEAMTGRIFDRLAGHFGREVIFRDIDSIPPGIDFRVHINEMLRQTNILLAVIGPDWLGPSSGGADRIQQESDAVRVEIETALRRRTPLIPILIGNTRMPSSDQLPPSLKDFAFRNAVRVDTGQDFDYHMDRLIRSIDGILSQSPKSPPSGETKIPSGASRSDTGSRQAVIGADTTGKKDTGSRAAAGASASEKTSAEKLSFAAVMPRVSSAAFWPADRQGQIVRLAVAGAVALALLGVIFVVFLQGSGSSEDHPLSLTGHTGPVSSVAFSPNSALIAGGSSDKSVMVWDAASGLLRHTLTGETEAVYTIAFEPNGRRVVSGGKDGIIDIRDVDSGQRIGRPLRPEMTYGWDVLPAVLSLAVSPDGTQIAAGNADGTVKIWNVSTNGLLHILPGHSDAVTSVAYSADGKTVVSGSIDGTIRVWDPNGGQAMGTVRGPSGQILSVAVSPDGGLVAAGGSGATVTIWNLPKLQQVQTLLTQLSSVNALAFAHDSRRLAVGGSDTNVQIWDTAAGRLLHSLSGHAGNIRALAYSPDGRRLASGSDDTTVDIWPAN
ncbi:MAG: TIR domain-containing protein [Xanthobacteraceae bacterium]